MKADPHYILLRDDPAPTSQDVEDERPWYERDGAYIDGAFRVREEMEGRG